MASNTYRIDWRGPELLDKARAGAVTGLTELDLRVQASAQAELYPGHGLLTGALRRGVVGEEATAVSDTLVRGRVAVKGIPYARVIERRYGYLAAGWRKEQPQAGTRVSARIKEAIGG